MFIVSPDRFNFRRRGPLLLPTCLFWQVASILPNSFNLSFLTLLDGQMTSPDRWITLSDRWMTLFSHIFPASTSRSYLWNLYNIVIRPIEIFLGLEILIYLYVFETRIEQMNWAFLYCTVLQLHRTFLQKFHQQLKLIKTIHRLVALFFAWLVKPGKMLRDNYAISSG